MKKLLLDTSVLSAYFDERKPGRMAITKWWMDHRSLEYELFVSDLVIEEIMRTPNDDRRNMMVQFLAEKGLRRLRVDENVLRLSEVYRTSLLADEENDRIHIATATYYGMNAIVSWNFRHLVNLETIQEIHRINVESGFRLVEILSVQELGGDEYGKE